MKTDEMVKDLEKYADMKGLFSATRRGRWRATAQRLRDLDAELRELQYRGADHRTGIRCCIRCRALQVEGCVPNCPLAALLEGETP